MLTPSTWKCDHCGQVRHVIVGSPNRPGTLGQTSGGDAQRWMHIDIPPVGGSRSPACGEVDSVSSGTCVAGPSRAAGVVAVFPMWTRTFMPCVSHCGRDFGENLSN